MSLLCRQIHVFNFVEIVCGLQEGKQLKSVTIVYLYSWGCPLNLIPCAAFVSHSLSTYVMTCAFHMWRKWVEGTLFLRL